MSYTSLDAGYKKVLKSNKTFNFEVLYFMTIISKKPLIIFEINGFSSLI